jgi:hypothetical protein
VAALSARLDVDNPELGPGRLTIQLQNPNGDKVTLSPREYATNASGTATYYWQLDPTTPGAATLFANATVDGQWAFTVTDVMSTSGGTGGTLHTTDLTLFVAGGPDELARDSVWTSQVVDTMTGLVDIESVTWVERSTTQPAKVRVRACDAPCTNEPWVDAQNGAAAAVGTGHRYLQTQAELFSDGYVAPELDELTVVYKRNVM